MSAQNFPNNFIPPEIVVLFINKLECIIDDDYLTVECQKTVK